MLFIYLLVDNVCKVYIYCTRLVFLSQQKTADAINIIMYSNEKKRQDVANIF